MRKLVKPYCLLLYILAVVSCFFIGLTYAGIIEAGKGQMLAGGAIILGYGAVGAFIGLFAALLIAYRTQRHLIIKLNLFLTLLIIVFFCYFTIKFQKQQQENPKKELNEKEQFKTPKPTAPAMDAEPLAFSASTYERKTKNSQIGLGMFSPDFYEHKTLYFYTKLALGKSVQEHIPIDSIVFKEREHGGFNITSAPPWLKPHHLKLDYDMLYFKVKSISYDVIEVIVNTNNNQTAFVDKTTGKLQYWPEFLLHVHSVEFKSPNTQKVFLKPLDHAAQVTTNHSFMKPIRIQHHWMYVSLWDSDFKSIGNGWIKWRDNEQLLIIYSLLS